MTKKILWVLLVVMAIVIAILLKKPAVSVDQTVIKVGAPLLLSGDEAKYGENAKNGIEMALSTYNSSQDVLDGKLPKVQAIYEDTHGDPKTALSAYEKLVTVDKVTALLGPLFQTEISALMPSIQKDNTPVFGIAPVAPDLRGKSDPLSIWPDPTLEAGSMAQYVYNTGVRRIGILGTKDSWENEVSSAFADKFKQLGGTVTDMEITLPDSKDVSLPVTKVIADHPDAVYLGTYFQFQYFIKKLKDLGYIGRIYSIEVDSYLAGITKPYSNGVEFISPAYFDPAFAQRYKDLYQTDPSIPAGQSYDAANLFLAILSAGTTTDPVAFKRYLLDQMANITQYNGVSGMITFTPDHRAIFPLYIYRIQDGNISQIK